MLIVAAHGDDVLLGCSTLLHYHGLEVWVFSEGQREGQSRMAMDYGYSLVIWANEFLKDPEKWASFSNQLRLKRDELTFLPSPLDPNPEHRIVSSLSGMIPACRFYSVMPVGFRLNDEKSLSPVEWHEKKEAFRRYFPEEAKKFISILERSGPWEGFSGRPCRWHRTLGEIPWFGS